MEILLALAFIFGPVFGLFLIAYDDGVSFAMWKRIRCKAGWHKIVIGFGKNKISKYYCIFCKKSRKHPKLKIVDSRNKLKDTGYKF